MAIDSQSKRMAVSGMLLPGNGISILADGADTANDRAAASWMYGGVIVTAAAAGTGRAPYMRIVGRKLWL